LRQIDAAGAADPPIPARRRRGERMSSYEVGKFYPEIAPRGYALNRMCYSLNSLENRLAYIADPVAYCDAFGLSVEEREAAISKDKEKLVAAGGNMYFFSKLDRATRLKKEA
jgi:protocatechuate 4,5-dioxygenase alpha subunit